MSPPKQKVRLRKELDLLDVYAISTGAMFSSGFFLLPGLAAAQTGPSVGLAYLVAGLFVLPAVFSVAELSTAMPRAGGAYYFLDRSMGPMVGTLGGLGTWVALMLKSAFALVGMGAYLALYLDVPMKPLAVGFTVLFAVVNAVGSKESSGLQRWLVATLILILGAFVGEGLWTLAAGLTGDSPQEATPFFTHGFAGFMGTVGFVFVSYAGLTKVASVSEEVRNPDRNIPLGMMLSLGTAAALYSIGVYIIVALVPLAELAGDLTPVATAASVLFAWLPGDLGVLLVVVAAVAAFASTGNAGILSASRYPLAMARDRLVPQRLGSLGRFRTPTFSIIVTSALIAASILVLNVDEIAKLASAFQLLMFSLLNLAVIIMRESRIEAYDPGYRSPLYPWMQIAGSLAPMWLIAEMGQMAILFSLGLLAVAAAWYFLYARDLVEREGAIFHTFARLGERRHDRLDLELRAIVKEKGLRPDDPFDEVVARAAVLDYAEAPTFGDLLDDAARALHERTGVPAQELSKGLRSMAEGGFVPVGRGVALPHLRVAGLPRPAILLARLRRGSEADQDEMSGVRAALFLISPEDQPGQHLRLLGHLATHADDPGFLEAWMAAEDDDALRATLLRRERAMSVTVGERPTTMAWVGRPLRGLELPRGTLVALVCRNGATLVPDGSSVLETGDRLTIIGSLEGIQTLTAQLQSADGPRTDDGDDPPRGTARLTGHSLHNQNRS
ncbi:MAG: amino acid permease [Gemmatimonadota bacterium]